MWRKFLVARHGVENEGEWSLLDKVERCGSPFIESLVENRKR